MNKLVTKISLVAVSFLPVAAFAQSSAPAGANFFVTIQGFINNAIGLLFSIATLVFLWGVIQYVIAGGDEKKGASARTYMLYGIIGLAAMAAVWGFVNLIVDTLGLDSGFRDSYQSQLPGGSNITP